MVAQSFCLARANRSDSTARKYRGQSAGAAASAAWYSFAAAGNSRAA